MAQDTPLKSQQALKDEVGDLTQEILKLMDGKHPIVCSAAIAQALAFVACQAPSHDHKITIVGHFQFHLAGEMNKWLVINAEQNTKPSGIMTQ